MTVQYTGIATFKNAQMRNEMLNHFVKWKLNSYSTKPPLVTVMTYCISTAL